MKQADYLFLEVYDLYGNLIYNRFKYFPAGYHEHDIFFRAAPGVYLLRISYREQQEEFRIIKLE
ncbi:MAG: T9SS type A sorting domain-containing protein [Bacteroidota bacterium]